MIPVNNTRGIQKQCATFQNTRLFSSYSAQMAGWIDITLLITKEINLVYNVLLQYLQNFSYKKSELLRYESPIFISIISSCLISCLPSLRKVVEYLMKKTEKTSESRFPPVCQQTGETVQTSFTILSMLSGRYWSNIRHGLTRFIGISSTCIRSLLFSQF